MDKKTDDDDFEVGDLVKHITGGPTMAVFKVSAKIECRWWMAGEATDPFVGYGAFRTGCFHSEELRHAKKSGE